MLIIHLFTRSTNQPLILMISWISLAQFKLALILDFLFLLSTASTKRWVVSFHDCYVLQFWIEWNIEFSLQLEFLYHFNCLSIVPCCPIYCSYKWKNLYGFDPWWLYYIVFFGRSLIASAITFILIINKTTKSINRNLQVIIYLASCSELLYAIVFQNVMDLIQIS